MIPALGTPYAAEQPRKKKKKSLQIINTGEGMEKREPSYTVGGNVCLFSHFGKQYGGSSENYTILKVLSWAYIHKKL